MATLAAAWQGDPARLEAVAAAAFGMWSRAANLRFRAAAPGETPDILIGAQGEPEGIAFANVWHGPGEGGRRAAHPRHGLPQPRGRLDDRRRAGADRGLRPRHRPRPRDRPRDRPRPSRAARGADGLHEPGADGRADARRRRGGRAALRARTEAGRRGADNKVVLGGRPRRRRDAGATTARPGERGCCRQAAGRRDVVPAAMAARPIEGVFVLARPVYQRRDSRVRLT